MGFCRAWCCTGAWTGRQVEQYGWTDHLQTVAAVVVRRQIAVDPFRMHWCGRNGREPRRPGVGEGVTVGRGIAVAVGVKVGTARIARVGVAVEVATTASRPRAAQPATASRQSSSSPAKHQTRWLRGETGETGIYHRLGRSGERGTAAHCSPGWMDSRGYLLGTQRVRSGYGQAGFHRPYCVQFPPDGTSVPRAGPPPPARSRTIMTVTNHGLSALTHAPADKRLQWPFKDGKTYPISTSFNDATSGAKYPQKIRT